jgi:hypothetical protein
MVGFLLFCVVGFFTVAFGQQTPSKIVLKTICENGTEGCTVEKNCTWIIGAKSRSFRFGNQQNQRNLKKFFSEPTKSPGLESELQPNKNFSTRYI